MRVGFLESCAYIPEFLATWRKHPEQATGQSESASARRKMISMSRVAYQKAIKYKPEIVHQIPSLEKLLEFYEEQVVSFGLKESRNVWLKFKFLFTELLAGNRAACSYLTGKMTLNQISENNQFNKLKSMLAEMNVSFPSV